MFSYLFFFFLVGIFTSYGPGLGGLSAQGNAGLSFHPPCVLITILPKVQHQPFTSFGFVRLAHACARSKLNIPGFRPFGSRTTTLYTTRASEASGVD